MNPQTDLNCYQKHLQATTTIVDNPPPGSNTNNLFNRINNLLSNNHHIARILKVIKVKYLFNFKCNTLLMRMDTYWMRISFIFWGIMIK